MKEIFHRVSIRKYEDRAVEPEKIEAILKAAMAAPSATNQQPWDFYVIRNKEMIQNVAAVCQYGKFAKDAPVIIVSAYREECTMPVMAPLDLAIAMENLWLEADAQGLGGVWLGTAPIEENMKAVEEVVGIPAGQRAFAVFPLGYPAESRAQQDRFDASRIHEIK